MSDEEFAAVEPVLAPFFKRTGKRGRPVKADPRTLLNGMVWILSTGAQWANLPECYGSPKTVNRWMLKWSQDGTFQRLVETLARPELLDTDLASIDGSVVRAHKSAAGARKKIGQSSEESRKEQALGRSRGGLSTKLHLVCDGQGRPVSARLSAGQESEFSYAPELFRGLGSELGFVAVAGDKGYDSGALRSQALGQELMEPVLAARKLAGKDEYPGHAQGFDKLLYKGRNVVERLIGHLKEMRRIATRYDKLATTYLGFLHLAFLRIWFREL